MRLQGNTVLITGGTDGIGKAMAEEFLSRGNKVIVVGRNPRRLKAMEQQGCIAIACDVSKMDDLEKLSLIVQSEYPDLNILINNAGIQYNYLFPDEIHVIDKIEHEVAVNFLAPLRLTALLLPILKMNDQAAIVNVSSGLGLVPKKQAPVYCGTKAGIHIFSKALRYQLNQVKVFEIIPPLVDTAMTAGRGKSKISAEALVAEFMRAFAGDNYEVSIGKVKLLKLINRLSPWLAERLMKNG